VGIPDPDNRKRPARKNNNDYDISSESSRK
jgi:hypothetical protein